MRDPTSIKLVSYERLQEISTYSGDDIWLFEAARMARELIEARRRIKERESLLTYVATTATWATEEDRQRFEVRWFL